MVGARLGGPMTMPIPCTSTDTEYEYSTMKPLLSNSDRPAFVRNSSQTMLLLAMHPAVINLLDGTNPDLQGDTTK
ncbi:hypothetical protein J3F84DRAFT_324739 [Trichoderma pleuroticola]